MRPAAVALVVLLSWPPLLAGCTQGPTDSSSSGGAPPSPSDADPGRTYLVLRIDGNVTRDPPPPSPQANCGRTGNPFVRVDADNRSLYLVRRGGVPAGGNDFDDASWIVVWDRVAPDDNACGSRPALWAAEQPSFAWDFRAFHADVARAGDGDPIDLDGVALSVGAPRTEHQEGTTTSDGVHWASDLTFTLLAWSTADVHEVDSELDLPDVGATAAWHSELPAR